MSNFLFVALGGAVGAMARYAISLIPYKGDFPVLTLLTNIVGALVIGFIAGLATGKKDLSNASVLFWKTGLCGGFTTFSTFSLETVSLLQKSKYFLGIAYAILSVLFCLVGVLAGMALARKLHE